MLLPGTNVQIMDANDQQFQAFIVSTGIPVDEAGITEWSFDDRCGIINHCRKHGVDLFAEANKNNSESEQKQFGNNSENELIGELFDGTQSASQDSLPQSDTNTVASLRDDIDLLIEEIEKSSTHEQKQFGKEAGE